MGTKNPIILAEVLREEKIDSGLVVLLKIFVRNTDSKTLEIISIL